MACQQIPGAAASAGTPTPRPARGAPQNFRSLNIEIACALWPGDLDYHAIDARIINWAKKIINDDRKDWKRWSAVIHMQADILAYDRQTIFDMIRHAPDPEVCHQGNALKSYVADFLNQHGVRSEHTGEQNSGESHCGDEEHHEEATSNVQMEADRIDETQNDAGLPESQTGERPGKSHTAADLLPVTVATLPGHQPATCFNHLMVDIECMGRHPLAPVVAIAAVFFAPETGESGPEFYEVIDLHSAITCGGQPDGEAILWWLRQSSETRAAILSDTAIPLGEALLQFELFIGSHADGGTDTVQIWGNGAAFDNAIIRQSFVSAGLEPPWCFRNDRDVRTLVALGNAAGIDLRDSIPFEGVPHHALDDARHQVKYASAIWQRLMAH
ncbi:3'-5' exonuclease [Shimwellia blattae]|uniref:3'-5' exonuclease n=1 Tax=Shimwellia blattae TaxID=563 RepID=UPI001E5F3040|nr:3'-5' exonuclease [Shimwellia blattae]